PELFEACSTTEVDVVEPALVPPLSQASMPEPTGITPLPESLKLVMTTPITQQNTDDFFLANLFVEEKTNVLPVIESASVYGYDEHPTDAIASPLTRNINGHGVLIELMQRSRSRVLELALFFSVIMVVLSSVFWFSRMPIPDTSSRASQKMTHTI